jgi:heme/copper-type cytochrome/quinol oxidase subunit 2
MFSVDKVGVMIGTMLLIVGTVFITLGFVVMFLRALFKTVEQFEHTSFLDDDWMENEYN